MKITVSENTEFKLVGEATKKYVLMIVPLRGGGGSLMVLKEKELLPLKIGGGGKHLNGTPIKKGLFLWLHL